MADDLGAALHKVGKNGQKYALILGKKANRLLISAKAHDGVLLKAAAEECGGLGTIVKGKCVLEDDAVVFVSREEPHPSWTPALVKLAREAKFARPVRLRKLAAGESEEPGPEMAAPTTSAAASAAAPSPAAPASGSDAAAYNDRRHTLETRTLQVLKDHRGDTDKIRGVLTFAREKAEAGEYGRALAALDMLEKLLSEAGAAAAAPPAAEKKVAAPEKAPFPAPVSLVDLQKARLAWEKTRAALQAELEKLERAILDGCKDQEEFSQADVAGGVKNIYVVLEELDKRLIDKLDEALNAPNARRRTRLQRHAKRIIGEYLEFVNGDPLMAVIDDQNGFAAVAVHKTALNVLTTLSSKL